MPVKGGYFSRNKMVERCRKKEERMTKTEELKNQLTPAFLLYRQGQATLEAALQMQCQAIREVGLKFIPHNWNLPSLYLDNVAGTIKNMLHQIEEIDL